MKKKVFSLIEMLSIIRQHNHVSVSSSLGSQASLVEALLQELNSQVFVISDELSRARRGLASILDRKKIKKRVS